MKTEDRRISLYCDLFSIKARRTAGVKINTKEEKLKPYEKLFHYLSTDDLENLLNFLNKKIDSYELSLKREISMRGDEEIENISTSSVVEIPIEHDGSIYKILKHANKTDQQIIHENLHRLSNQNFDDDTQDLDDWDEWVESSFQEQTEYKCFEAYKAACEYHSPEKIHYLEAEYLLENNLSDEVKLFDYDRYIWEKHRLEVLICKQIFEQYKDEIHDLKDEKEAADHLIKKLFKNEDIAKYMASGCFLPTKLYVSLAKKAFKTLSLQYLKPLSKIQ